MSTFPIGDLVTTTDVRDVFTTFHSFLRLAESRAAAGVSPDGDSLYELLSRHLGSDPLAAPMTVWSGSELGFVSYDIARELLLERHGGGQTVGVSGGTDPNAMTLLQKAAASAAHGVCVVAAPAVSPLPCAPGTDRSAVVDGIHLFSYDGVPVVLYLRKTATFDDPMGRLMAIEVLGSRVAAEAILGDLHELRQAHTVYRGQVVRPATGSMGSWGVESFESGEGNMVFLPRPVLAADDVVLPDGVLERIERAIVAPSRHRDALRAAGQHLKRGVLLYGPPGTGKTLVGRYLASRWQEATVFVLSGKSLRFAPEVFKLASALAPSLVILDDADFLGESREIDRGGGPDPATFALLDAMDGLAGDSDVAFLLTTNRADTFESAIRDRPGRIDLGVEIPLPDAVGRRRLLERYSAGMGLSGVALTVAASRTEGLTGSAFKELLRRTELKAANAGRAVVDEDLHESVEELLELHDRFASDAADDVGALHDQGEALDGPGGDIAPMSGFSAPAIAAPLP